jgi:membrane-associated phospholipid phosphatase
MNPGKDRFGLENRLKLETGKDEAGFASTPGAYSFHWPQRSEGDTIREVSFSTVSGARVDTVPHINWDYRPAYNRPFPVQQFILPAAMIAYGFAGLKVAGLQNLNHKIREEVWEEDPHKRMHADNYLMYVPALAVYGLNAAGIHGEHNFKDRTMLLLMSQLFTQGTVFSLKGWTHTLRPDGSAYNSFPSGHTAEAFANAEFMRLEYKDVSPWYGIAGYAVATTTGMLRMYNNKHWLNDVVAGAGIGIASTRLAYWLYPRIQHAIFHDKSPGTVLMPSYNNGAVGLTFAKHF